MMPTWWEGSLFIACLINDQKNETFIKTFNTMKIKKLKTNLFFVSLVSWVVLLTSCGGGSADKQAQGGSGKSLIGAGSTFTYPLYSKMFHVYHQANAVKVNYQSIGSGAGIKQLQNKTIDFGASDAPMSDEEMKKSPGAIVHIPTCLGAVVVTYHLPGNPVLKFTPEVLAGIFLGEITHWNDPKITALNPDAKLPSLPISVVHRSDGSGTTYIFADYLSKVSPQWTKGPGRGKSLNWPVGLGSKGNEGVSGLIKQTPGSIGYVEFAYAFQNKMPVASIKNKAGNFIAPSLTSTSAAANVDHMPADLRVSITDTDAADGYPISSFSYVLLYKNQSYDNRSEAQAKATVDLIAWMIQAGQQYSEPLQYGKLPESVVKSALAILKTVVYNNKPLL
jgi:phosphate transport system substrate-binding protein